MRTRGVRDAGWTLVELMAVLAIIGILTSIAVASYVVAVHTSAEVTCGYNRKCLDTAFELYNNEHATPPDQLADLAPYVKSDRSMRCPDTGAYVFDADTGHVTCTEHE